MDKFQHSGVYMEHQAAGDLLLIEAYGGHGFRLNGRRVEGSVIVLESGFFPVAATLVSELTIADFDKLFQDAGLPEILFIGTGPRMNLLPPVIRQFLEEKNIPVELMDTGAAARTFNVLRMEGRKIAALLLAVE